MYSWPEPAVCAAAPSVTWGAHKDEKINKDEGPGQMLSILAEEISFHLQISEIDQWNWKNLNVSHVAFLQLGDFPLQLLIVWVAGRHPSAETGEHLENASSCSSDQHWLVRIRLLPALQAIDVLLLLLSALLSRLLITNLPAYFLQNPLFALIERRYFQWCTGRQLSLVLLLAEVHLCEG